MTNVYPAALRRVTPPLTVRPIAVHRRGGKEPALLCRRLSLRVSHGHQPPRQRRVVRGNQGRHLVGEGGPVVRTLQLDLDVFEGPARGLQAAAERGTPE